MKTFLALLFSCSVAGAQPFTLNSISFLANSQPLTGSGLSYSNVMLEYFTTGEGTPITSPRIAETGPGGWTVTQTDGSFAITNEIYQWETNIFPGSQLRFAAQTSPTIGDLKLIATNSLATNAGLCLIAKFRVQSGNSDIHVGFERSTVTGYPDAAAIRFSALTLGLAGRYKGNVIGAWPTVAANQDYEVAIILRPKGSYSLFRGGEIAAGSTDKVKTVGFPDWRLLWVDDLLDDATVYPDFDVMDANGYLDSVRVFKLDGWTDQYALASNRIEVTTNGASMTSPFDCNVEHTITAQTGVTNELRVRVLNPTNYFVVRCHPPGTNTIKLVEVNDGVETERQTAAKTWVNGTSYRISALCYHSNITAYIATDFAFSAPYATAPYSKDSVVTAEVMTAGSNFIVWPMRPTLTLGPVVPTRKILCLGDSRTQGSYDTNAPTGAYTGYPRYLADMLNTNGTLSFNVGRVALNSGTVGQIKTNLPGYISKIPDAPEFVLVNLGANDLAAGVSAQLTNDYAYILDSLHTNWPSATVYVTKFWVNTFDANRDAIRNLAAGLVATRGPWCLNGPDEAVFIENGDDGATYMYDTLHPNHAGYLLIAQKWREALGL